MSSRLSTGALKRSSGSAANIAAGRDLTTTLPMLKSGMGGGGGGGGTTPSKHALKKQRRSVSFGGAHVRMFDKLDAAAACNAVLQVGAEENQMEEEEMELTRSYTSRIEMMAAALTPSPAHNQQQQQQGYNTDDLTQTQTQPAPARQINIGDDDEEVSNSALQRSACTVQNHRRTRG